VRPDGADSVSLTGCVTLGVARVLDPRRKPAALAARGEVHEVLGKALSGTGAGGGDRTRDIQLGKLTFYR
jgi:hypothetical protein